ALADRGAQEVFFGEPGKAAADNTHLNDPRSVAVDAQGHVFIADFGNNRIVVLNEKDKSFAGSFAVESPSWIAVHSKTGEIYVCSKQTQLLKFSSPFQSSFENAKELARQDLSEMLKMFAERYRPGIVLCFALDATAEPAVLWASCSTQLVH